MHLGVVGPFVTGLRQIVRQRLLVGVADREAELLREAGGDGVDVADLLGVDRSAEAAHTDCAPAIPAPNQPTTTQAATAACLSKRTFRNMVALHLIGGKRIGSRRCQPSA
jgi:hypothetical protein